MNLNNYKYKKLAEIALNGSKTCIAQAEAVLIERFQGLLPESIERQAPSVIVDAIFEHHYSKAVDVLAKAALEPQTIREECLRLDVTQEVLLIEQAAEECDKEDAQ